MINKINDNGITYEPKRDITNLLDSYFVKKGKHISESMNAGSYDPANSTREHLIT